MKKRDYSYTQNRELSWLKFDDRVLKEAKDNTVPLLERLNFISIFTSNLDEFYMIRCGSLFDLTLIDEDDWDNKTGWSPQEQLDAIFKATKPLYEERDLIFDEIAKDLRKYGIVKHNFNATDVLSMARDEFTRGSTLLARAVYKAHTSYF